MTTAQIDIRVPTQADAAGLAKLHQEAWRYAYRGIIPGVALEMMIARRGPGWWRRAWRAGMNTLVLEFRGMPAGYVTFGRCRGSQCPGGGEIYELYLGPEYQGVGFGRGLFQAARNELRRHGLHRLIIWSLIENDTACRFYAAMGGTAREEASREIGGVTLSMVGYVWR